MQIRYLAATLVATLFFTASQAQNLSKEIVVEREVEPAERAANRPSAIAPTILQPTLTRYQLKTAEYGGTGQLTRSLTQLEPAAWADTFAVSPYRGYASAAYFPALNMAVSAGYRIVDKDKTRLGAWLQYDGSSYHMSSSDMAYDTDQDKVTLKRHSFSIGADLTQSLSKFGSLTASGRYTVGMLSLPMVGDDFDQTVTRASLAADWINPVTGKWLWQLGASIAYFGYDKATPFRVAESPSLSVAEQTLPAVAETAFGFRGAFGYRQPNYSLSLEAIADFQHLNHVGMVVPTIASTGEDLAVAVGEASVCGLPSATYGVTTIRPRYDVTYGSLTASLAVGADIATGDGTKLGLSADVAATLAPVSQFAIWAKFNTGRQLNTLAELYEINPYQLSNITNGSNRVSDFQVGVTAGPFYGLSFQLWGGYSKAKDCLMSAQYGSNNFFVAQTLDGIYYGARLEWQMRKLVSLHVQGEGAPSKLDKGYYRWTDHARWALSAGVSVNPIEHLSVGIDYALRTGRKAYMLSPISYGLGETYAAWDFSFINLGNTGSLNLDARYAFTESFSVFANIENLLCRRWYIAPQVKSQRMHGLVGVSVKF